MTSLVPPEETALLYTIISLVSTVGTLVGMPVLGLALSKGIDLGGFARGLPFFLGAVLYLFSGLSIWSIRAPRDSN